jgi:hypothetical protein
MNIGTIGEILVQLRLLQFGVQAAPPLKDSGNDLVALKESEVRTIQIKTSAKATPRAKEKSLPKYFDILALVKLEWHSNSLMLDASKVYLIRREDIKLMATHKDRWLISKNWVEELFRPHSRCTSATVDVCS